MGQLDSCILGDTLGMARTIHTLEVRCSFESEVSLYSKPGGSMTARKVLRNQNFYLRFWSYTFAHLIFPIMSFPAFPRYVDLL
jgi:hypothetical protein